MIAIADTIRPGVTRGLDFIVIDELQKRTGVAPNLVLPFALGEILCNALDKDDASEIYVAVQTDEVFDELTIADNGTKKLSRSDLSLILDFENKASSKRGFLRVSRGYLGNALKCILGYSYALAESKNLTPPAMMVASGDSQYQLTLKPDRIQGLIKADIVQTRRQDDGYTVFSVKFPRSEDPSITARLRDIIFATALVNPSRKISFNLYGNQGTLGTPQPNENMRRETSVLWYTSKQFTELFEDYLRARPETQLKEYVALFRGFSGRKIVREILQDVNACNRDSQSVGDVQFFPTSTLKELSSQSIRKLYAVMKARTKAIKKRSIPAVLASVGKDCFETVRQQKDWERVRYIALSGATIRCPDPYGHLFVSGGCDNPDHVEYPYLVELAVFDRNDKDGLQVYQCVNFMASSQSVFSSSFDVKYRLGRVGMNVASSVTVIVHLVCPVLPWLNYGKSALGNIDSCGLIEKAFDKILPIPKAPREYHPPPPPRPLSWIPHGKLGDETYEERLKSFATEIKAIQSQQTGSVKYASRDWCYLFEGLRKIDKGEFDACQKAINDCRKIGLLPIDFVKEDQDTTRHFKGIHNAADPTVSLRQIKDDVASMLDSLPSNTTDYWVGERFYVMMCVEKGSLLDLFKPICSEYHVPLVSSRGWAPILLRSHIAELSKKAEARGLTPVLLLFYDHDPVGLKITETFRKNLDDCIRATHWDPENLIIERFGLNKADIDRLGLTWISNVQTGSGRESRDWKYLQQFGRVKCEANALFKNDDTLKAGVELCRKAIEKYYDPDALERFEHKENESKKKLAEIYTDPAWKNFDNAITGILESFSDRQTEQIETTRDVVPEKEVEVLIKEGFYGYCPKCRMQFDYSDDDIGRLVCCRRCGLPMRLKMKPAQLEPQNGGETP